MLGLVYRVRFRSTPSLKGYLVIDLQPRPAEARTQEDPEKVDLNRLILLADIAHKYECSSLEEWATDIIRIHWSSAFGHDEIPLLADQLPRHLDVRSFGAAFGPVDQDRE